MILSVEVIFVDKEEEETERARKRAERVR